MSDTKRSYPWRDYHNLCNLTNFPQIFRLFVQRPPWNLTSNLKQRKFETKLGKPFGLSCTAKGKPKPKITWKRRDNKLLRIVDKKFGVKSGKIVMLLDFQNSYY